MFADTNLKASFACFVRQAARAAIVRVFALLFGLGLTSQVLFWFQGVGDSVVDKKNSYSSLCFVAVCSLCCFLLGNGFRGHSSVRRI